MNDRIARCMLLAKVLTADGMMTDAERDFLESSMDSFGLTSEEKRAVRDLDDWHLAEPIVAALSADEKRQFMDGLVTAVLADGKVSPHEMSAIEKLSVALGIE